MGQIWLISCIVLWIFSYRSYIYRSVLLKETDIYRHRLKIASHHKCSFKWYHIWYWYNVRRYFFFFMHIIWGAKTKTEDGRRLYVPNIQTSICPCFHSVFYVHSLNSKQVEFLYQGSIVTMTKSLFISVIAH